MKNIKYVMLFLTSTLVLSCAAPYNRNFPLIDEGMNLSKVTELIGEPISAKSGSDDTKILYYRLASSPLDTDGSDTSEYYVVMKSRQVIGYGERTDTVTRMREIRQFNSAWNAVDATNNEKYHQNQPVANVFTPSPSGRVPLGIWSLRHGHIRTVYGFNANGNYIYERIGHERQDEEAGTYNVQGNRLTPKPNGKPQRILRWRIGSDATALAGEQILWLIDDFGREEQFFPGN